MHLRHGRGFYQLLEAIADPTHSGHADAKAKTGPETFDDLLSVRLQAVQRRQALKRDNEF
jgi:hypothetical protein